MHPCKILWDAVSQPFKRSQTGLFQGKMKQYGNNVPFSKHKTRRSWLPNVQQKRLPSEILGTPIRVKLTTRALRTIKKKGGLDNYLKTTNSDILGHTGMKLRMRVLDAESVKQGVARMQHQIPPLPKGKSDGWLKARLARAAAAQALGRGSGELASAEETIEFLGGKSKHSTAEREYSSSSSTSTA